MNKSIVEQKDLWKEMMIYNSCNAILKLNNNLEDQHYSTCLNSDQIV